MAREVPSAHHPTPSAQPPGARQALRYDVALVAVVSTFFSGLSLWTGRSPRLEETAEVLELSPTSESVAPADPGFVAPAPAPTPASDARRDGADPNPGAIASYRLRADLDPTTHRIEASGTITLRNASTRTLDDVYLHLYLNAFKNSETLFGRSPFRAGRSGNKADEWGYCQVTKLTQNGHDLWSRREYPLGSDETDVRIRLVEPIPSGQTLNLDVEFKVQLPEIVERTGFSRDYHFVAQWFPKLAKLEPSGEWAHFAFHPQSEFYADFGDYDVELRVPHGFVTGASGELIEENVEEGVHTQRYQAKAVHDFAWVSWPGFRERRETVDGVRVRVLYPPGHDHNAELELSAIRFGLPHYGERYGRYPYSVLTVVHPPRHARNSGGMEYPTLITTGGGWYAGAFSRSIELVTLHELAHQWFYGLVATNEHESPFLDEGLASYAELVAAREWLGSGGALDRLGLRVSVEALHRFGAARVSGTQSVALPASEFASFGQLSGLVYSRTATLLSTLERVYGPERLRKALFRYSSEQRFRHPTPGSLLDVIQSELGVEAREQAERVLFERGTVDYGILELASTRTPGRSGLFGDDLSENPAPPPGGFSTRLVLVRRGTVAFPVTVELGYEDGHVERHDWDGLSEVHEILTTSPSRAAWANVDPELRVPLDDNLLDNTSTLSPTRSIRTAERLTYVAQLVARSLGP